MKNETVNKGTVGSFGVRKLIYYKIIIRKNLGDPPPLPTYT